MKKFIYAIFAIVAVAFTSCEKAEVDMMETVAMAGDWVMEFSNGEDSWGADHCLTFNTAANVPTEIWVSDAGGFWDFQAKVKCDLNTMTFASENSKNDNWVTNISYKIQINEDAEDEEPVYIDAEVRITNGKITKNGLTLPSGRVVDTISFDIEFNDDEDHIIWHATGRRYTGFAADN